MFVAVAGGAAGFIAAWFAPWQLSTLIGWDVAAALYLVWVWSTAGLFTPAETREFATREDNSRVSAQLLVLGACVVSLVGVGFDLLKASESGSGSGDIAARLGRGGHGGPVVGDRAHRVRVAVRARVLRPTAGRRHRLQVGPDFEPDYRDFAYVAFGIGMTYQVADTDINDRGIRHTILRHSLLAYLFGAVILAVTINVVAAIFQ